MLSLVVVALFSAIFTSSAPVDPFIGRAVTVYRNITPNTVRAFSRFMNEHPEWDMMKNDAIVGWFVYNDRGTFQIMPEAVLTNEVKRTDAQSQPGAFQNALNDCLVDYYASIRMQGALKSADVLSFDQCATRVAHENRRTFCQRFVNIWKRIFEWIKSLFVSATESEFIANCRKTTIEFRNSVKDLAKKVKVDSFDWLNEAFTTAAEQFEN